MSDRRVRYEEGRVKKNTSGTYFLKIHKNQGLLDEPALAKATIRGVRNWRADLTSGV